MPRVIHAFELWLDAKTPTVTEFHAFMRMAMASGVVGRPEWPGRPDLAIEVNWTSGGIDKLEVYDRLEVPEVWFWEDDRLTIHVRKPRGGYAKRRKSSLFPTLDLEMFSAHAADPDQNRALRAFLAALRKN